MKVNVHSLTHHQSVRTPVLALLATLAGAWVALTAGCSSPVAGPTDPKEFMVQRRTWTTLEAAPTRPEANAPVANDAPLSPAITPAPDSPAAR